MTVDLVAGEKMKGEGKNPVLACNDFLRMGPGRSLPKLLAEYTKSDPDRPPTRSIGTLKKWSTYYGWQERADLYDAAVDAEKQATERQRRAEIAKRRKEIMEEGIAQDFERVALLKGQAAFLQEQIYYQPKVDLDAARLIGIAGLLGLADAVEDEDDLTEIARIILTKLDLDDPKNRFPHVWARDIKAIAGGKTVETFRFNASLMAELRATLADIAAETGGRRQRTITENIEIDYSKLSDEQIQRILDGEDEIKVILSGYVSSES